jgi:hypothetical protein
MRPGKTFTVILVVIVIGLALTAYRLTALGKRPSRLAASLVSDAKEDTIAGSEKEKAESTSPATFPDPNAPGTSKRVFVDNTDFDAGVFATAYEYTGSVINTLSLEEVKQSILDRSPRAFEHWRAQANLLASGLPTGSNEAIRAIRTWRALAFLEMHDGRMEEAKGWLERGLTLSRTPGVPDLDRAYLQALLGIASLRQGELDNCVACIGPSSCIFPIDPAAVHQQQDGSREAIRHFTAYLEERPGDLRVRWLLNLAYMTLGEYPEKVPPAYLIPLDRFESATDVGRFTNIATLVGITASGPTLAGGSIFDDFDGDDRPDLFTTTVDAEQGARFLINRGDGQFEDRSRSAGVADQVYALNITRADFDNDGDLDVLLLRGGWESAAPPTLMRNRGDGSFEDVTTESRLGEPIASESAAWGDYNNDGLVDVFICGEAHEAAGGPSRSSDASSSARNLCRLFRNLGEGRFENVAAEAGVTNGRFAKGAVWGDYDNDGLLDLFVSNLDANGRLYHNEGNGHFRDVAGEVGLLAGVTSERPLVSFPCLFWDYDNDGRLDLLINDWRGNQAEIIAWALGLPVEGAHPPRLFRNLGDEGFRDVAREVGLTSPIAAMSINCGDIDNDGYLDLYCGTGWMSYSGLIPNVMLRNVGGQRFEDVTASSGTGHLQKGHGISFADWDGDGDLDLFTILGGGYPGDRGYSALFQNPGHNRHWLKIKLVGTTTNRAALGARIEVQVKSPSHAPRSIHRMVGTNGSFGGNSLVEHLGLGDSDSEANVIVTWPTSGTTQVFSDIAVDQFLEITEGIPTPRVIQHEPIGRHYQLSSVQPSQPR